MVKSMACITVCRRLHLTMSILATVTTSKSMMCTTPIMSMLKTGTSSNTKRERKSLKSLTLSMK